jgi:hypothetical protein
VINKNQVPRRIKIRQRVTSIVPKMRGKPSFHIQHKERSSHIHRKTKTIDNQMQVTVNRPT